MGPYQRTPKKVARANRYSGLGVRSVGPVGDFLESERILKLPNPFHHGGKRGKTFDMLHGKHPMELTELVVSPIKTTPQVEMSRNKRLVPY